MKGERAELRYKAERWIPKSSSMCFGANKTMYLTLRFDTHAEAVAYYTAEVLQMNSEPVGKQLWGFNVWKLYELKLISWDDEGKTTIERRSLE